MYLLFADKKAAFDIVDRNELINENKLRKE